MSIFKRLTRKKHSTGSAQSTSKLISVSGSFIEDFPAASSLPTEETRSNNENSSSIIKKIFSNIREPPKREQLAAPLVVAKRTPSPRAGRAPEASIVDLEAKINKLSGSIDGVSSTRNFVDGGGSRSTRRVANDSFDNELRHLNAKTRRVITDELDANNSWKALASELNHPDQPSEKLFLDTDIQLLNDEKKVKSPSEEILKTWSTTGRNRPRIKDLYDVLRAILQLKIANQLMFDVQGVSASLSLDDEFQRTALDFAHLKLKASSNEATVDFANMKACLSHVYQICYDDVDSATGHFSASSSNKIAEGSFGVVYKVKIDGQDMAVKLFKEDIQQIANEIEQLNTFDHPNVLPLYGVAFRGDSLCMITKFMNNGSLQQMLASSILDWPLRFRILRDVAAGLEYVHSFNVIHRDVKPANILLDGEMKALIADFGLARKKNSFHTSRTAFAAGTGYYMAPEAIHGALVLQSDVYSFGVVALEVFSGLPVFDASRADEILTAHIGTKSSHEACDARIPHPSDSLREDSYEWIQKCLTYNKRQRPDMMETHQQFDLYFERICDEDSSLAAG